jgi:hypothetical protein
MREAACPTCGTVVQKQSGIGMPSWVCPEHGIFTPRMKRSAPKQRSSTERAEATEFYRATMAAWGHECAVTGEPWRARSRRDPLRLEAHHVVDQQVLERKGLEHLLWDPDNGMAVTAAVHAGHTTAMRRIPREVLSARNIRFARTHDLMDEIERKYPTKEEANASSRPDRR